MLKLEKKTLRLSEGFFSAKIQYFSEAIIQQRLDKSMKSPIFNGGLVLLIIRD